MEYEVEGSKPRGRPKRTWKEVVREDCQARKLNKEDAVDRCKWRKVIKEVRWPGWVWAGECFIWYRPIRVVPDKRPLNGCCCCRKWGRFARTYWDIHQRSSWVNHGGQSTAVVQCYRTPSCVWCASQSVHTGSRACCTQHHCPPQHRTVTDHLVTGYVVCLNCSCEQDQRYLQLPLSMSDCQHQWLLLVVLKTVDNWLGAHQDVFVFSLACNCEF